MEPITCEFLVDGAWVKGYVWGFISGAEPMGIVTNCIDPFAHPVALCNLKLYPPKLWDADVGD